MDDSTIKIVIYSLGIVASLIAVIASAYKVYEAKIRIKAHNKEKKQLVPKQSTEIQTKAEAKLQKKQNKQLAKILKKNDKT